MKISNNRGRIAKVIIAIWFIFFGVYTMLTSKYDSMPIHIKGISADIIGLFSLAFGLLYAFAPGDVILKDKKNEPEGNIYQILALGVVIFIFLFTWFLLNNMKHI